jgi:glycosyltransferase involved in cell wall biosynthesis
MRILFLSHYYPPEVNAPAARTSEHCQRWASQGHEVTVVTCVPNCPDGAVFGGYRNRLRRQVEMRDGVEVIRIWTCLAPNAGRVRRILNYLSYMISAVWAGLWVRRPDVIIATSPQFFCGWAGVWVSRLRRCRFVLEIRDIWPESIAAVGAMKKGVLTRILEWLELRMYAAADRIVTVGEGYRRNLESKGVPSSRICTIMNGVDLDRFQPVGTEAVDELRRQWGLGERFVCSYIGTVGMAHGLEVVVEAAAVLTERQRKQFVFFVVGDGARLSELKRLAARKGVEECIVFTGRQPRDLMPAILCASDACLVHLRGTELFGTVVPSKIFETMAMNRPILMAVKGEARQIILEAEAGIAIEPESAGELVAAMGRLASDTALRQALGENGRRYVAEHFDRNRLAREYLSRLAEICGSEGGIADATAASSVPDSVLTS